MTAALEALPRTVRAFTTDAGVTFLHLPDGTAAAGELTTVDAARAMTMVRWCNSCWPGRRCEVCNEPSGQAVECHTCWSRWDRICERLADQ